MLAGNLLPMDCNLNLKGCPVCVCVCVSASQIFLDHLLGLALICCDHCRQPYPEVSYPYEAVMCLPWVPPKELGTTGKKVVWRWGPASITLQNGVIPEAKVW